MGCLWVKLVLGYSLGRSISIRCDFFRRELYFDVDGDFELDEFDAGVHHRDGNGAATKS
jgi:hypothetical protein